MKKLRAWWLRIRGFASPRSGERDFANEIQSHLEHQFDDNVRAGITHEEARRRALARMGSIAAVAEAQRDQRGLPRLESIIQDARYALRSMRRQPAFAAACMATLALGIGANSAIFSVVNGVLFAPLPYDKPEQLASIWIGNPQLRREASPLSLPDALALQRTLTTASHVEFLQAIIIPSSLVVNGQGIPAQAVLMTSGMFRLLGRPPLLGRFFEENDVTTGIVLSYAFWQRHFGGDASVIGRSLSDGRRVVTVVGVMPKDFGFPYASMLRANISFSGSSDVDFWVGMPSLPDGDPSNVLNRNTRIMAVIARVKDGAGMEQLRADAGTAWDQLARAYPAANEGWRPEVVPLHQQAVGGVQSQLLLLLGCVGIVLLVACVNVTNLLLARGVARRRELALRSALGAARGRLLQQVVIEALVLSATGAVAGIAIARLITPLLVQWAPAGTPRLAEIDIDWTVMAFAAGMAALCGVVVGLVPGFSAARVSVRQVIDEGSRGSSGARHRLRDALVAAQVALAVVLAVGAGLLARSSAAVLATDPGFQAGHLLTMQVSAPGQYDTPEKRLGFYTQLFSRLDAVPGVIATGGTTRLPLGGANSSTQVAIVGSEPPEGQWPEADFRRSVHRYFETMGIPVRSGRGFTDADREGAPPVAVVNQAFVQKIFGGADPIGRQIKLGPGSPVRQATVVGVIGDLRHQRLDAAPNAEVYLNYLQAAPNAPLLVIRTTGDPAGMSASILAAIREVDATAVPLNVKTMDELRSASVSPRIFLMALIAAFGGLALALAAVGVYGVLSLVVAERTREIGIRLALGATPTGMVTLVVTRAFGLAASGLAAGIVLALAMSPLLRSQLYGVGGADPITIGAVVMILLSIALIAAAIPAARVLRVDPVKTLRCE